MMKSPHIIRMGLLVWILALPLLGQARIKDLVDVEGVQGNALYGIGLVVGLNKTGDGSLATLRAASHYLQRNNLQIPPNELVAANMALVHVEATHHAFAKPGSKLDISVQSMGDAKSLRGGTLVLTELRGIDGQVYATANGAISAGGVTASGQSGSSETINHPTAGRISGGAKVERAIEQRMVGKRGEISFLLRRPDYQTALTIAEAINARFPTSSKALDAVTIEAKIPTDFAHDPVRFLADIGEISVAVAQRAIVVIDERNGTIVAGGDVVILPGVISKSNLTISVRETPEVSQPNPLAEGETVVVPRSDVQIRESSTPLIPIKSAVGADQLANTLNALGASSLDMIAIFQSLKQAGMLHAEVIVQ